jgi:hypothetical protein
MNPYFPFKPIAARDSEKGYAPSYFASIISFPAESLYPNLLSDAWKGITLCANAAVTVKPIISVSTRFFIAG